MKHYLKFIISCAFFCVMNSMLVALQTTPESEAKARQNWLQRFNNSPNLPNEEAIPILGDGIRRLGDQSIFHDQDAARPIYQEGQRILLSIPGHAYYYRDQINAAKPKLRSGEISLNDWFNLLMYSFQTLQHMPSEETVEVLGEFGKDQFGLPGSENPDDYKNIPGIEGWDSDLSSAGTARISPYAYNALDSLGIESPPDEEKNVSLRDRVWGPWWEEVRTGRRKYRFKGSDALHPVNAPPGAPREIRRPGRHPGPPGATEKSGAKPVTAPDENSRPVAGDGHGGRWPLFAGIGALLLVTAAYLLKRRGG